MRPGRHDQRGSIDICPLCGPEDRRLDSGYREVAATWLGASATTFGLFIEIRVHPAPAHLLGAFGFLLVRMLFLESSPTQSGDALAMSITLRPALADDEEFLFELFRQTVTAELAMLGDAILRMQFMAQQLAYSAEFPASNNEIIMLGDRPIGRVLVERNQHENRGVDIALLAEYRSGGVGRMLIQELLDEAARAGKPFRISVVKTNPAIHLYERLGFKTTGDSGTQLLMEWVAGD